MKQPAPHNSSHRGDGLIDVPLRVDGFNKLKRKEETKEDREMTQNIRQAIIDDKSLSTNAHNVKVITVRGMVTLKGPVRSEEEKRTIEEIAGQVAGRDKITSEIGIAP